MGLRIIYGKAGSGKSEFIYKEINERITSKEKNKIFIITPEQFSYTAEKKLMENKKSIINAEVITFNRMAHRIVNEIGGTIHNNITKCGKAMLIYSILQNEKKNLKLLNKSDENIELVMRTISEFKKNNISISDLKNELNNINDDLLKLKLEDMILIYDKFNLNLQNKYIDETDLLTILAENIDKVDLFKNCNIYIDEFVGYTKQELEIIKKLLNISKNVTITFCIDNLELNTNPDTDIFYPNKVTLNKILKLLKNDEKIEIINLDKLYRFKNNELIFIENYLYNQKIKKYENEINNIKLFLAKNKYSEIEYIANNIINLVKKENYKYNEIAIITKDVNSYSSLFKSIFSKYEIPVFIDEKKDLNQNIIVRYILSIIEIIIKNYSYESIFNYLKINFLEIDEDDIFKLEKYCIKYGIKNNKFKKDFIYGINENTKNEINYLNKLRKKIIEPIINLENKINKKQNAENIIKEIYLFLNEQKIENKINKRIKELEKNNFFELASEYKISYEIIINIFDEIVNIFKNEKITLENVYKILKIGLKNSDLGKIPSKQDGIIVGDTERSRTHKVKSIFIVGLNDGVFPSINRDEGYFNDTDRGLLKDNGIELAKGSIDNLYDDNFNIYKAFTTAEEKIFLSYCMTDLGGNSLRPSSLILKMKKIFLNLKEESDILEKKYFLINEKNIYENLIFNINYLNENKNNLKENNINNKINLDENNINYENKINLNENNFNEINNLILFYKYFKENKNYKKILKNNLEYIKFLKSPKKIKKENIEKLYGKKLNTSISRLETFKSCPYEYFLGYSLKLKEKEELKVGSLDTGSFMHDVIHSFFEELNENKISVKNIEEKEQEEIINKIIDEKLQNDSNYIFVATEKYKFLVKRLKRMILKALKYIILSLKISDFNVKGTEVSFNEKDGEYKPIKIELEDGKIIEIVGKIDRIDIAKDENNRYVRIIDYKSSIKNINYSDVYAGLQLQLITYLDAVCKIEDFVPAGILYFSLLEQMNDAKKKITEEEIEQKIKNNFKMRGLILADVNVAKMQDNTMKASSYSQIIPAYLDKDENLSSKKSNIASVEEFEKLQKYVNNTIKEIGKEILNGNIELKPYYKNKLTPCRYCIYKKICGFNSGIFPTEYNYINKKTKEDIYNYVDEKI